MRRFSSMQPKESTRATKWQRDRTLAPGFRHFAPRDWVQARGFLQADLTIAHPSKGDPPTDHRVKKLPRDFTGFDVACEAAQEFGVTFYGTAHIVISACHCHCWDRNRLFTS